MKEFINKLIERLEEEHERCINRYGVVGGNLPAMEVKQCMGIVNQLAEEYDQTIDVAELVEKFGQEKVRSNDGWIPCSSGELPMVDDDYARDFTVDVLVWDGYTYFEAYYDLYTGTWMERSCEEECENKIIAWKYQHPYQPKGE